MMTLDPLIHDTFNSPLGDTGDHEGHSVIRTENGGYWYADEVTDDDHIIQVHAEIVRRVNAYPQLVEALQNLLTVSENADETGYVDGEGWLPLERIQEAARAALSEANDPALRARSDS